MIQFNRVTKSFGAQVLFDDLSFGLNRRERVGLVGRNGHGKTTVFRMILGEISPDSGDIVLPKRYRIGHLDQHIRFTQPTLLEEASLGLPPDERDQTWRAEQILFGLGFGEDDMARAPELFSGGFQVRLNLAKVLVSEPDLLLLDEPTNYLDVVSIRWLERFLIIVPALGSKYLPYSHGRYEPQPVEFIIAGATFAAMTLLYVLFVKVVPIISIWELKAGGHQPPAVTRAETEKPRLREQHS